MLHQSRFIILLIFPRRLLMDHRPFWWVHETDVYGEGPYPVLRQTPLTCENGPGSPSGHVQGVTSIMYVVLQHFIRNFIKSSMKMDDRKKTCVIVTLWTLYILLVILVGISRLYIATHFPHQVLLGLLAGSVTLICKTIVWFCSVEMCCQFV
jgi:glucose-6-phosphatase